MKWQFCPATQFSAHAAAWDRLNQEGAGSPLLSTDFVGPLLAQFANGSELLACGQIDHQRCAMLLLVPGARGTWQTFQPSQAPLGACVHRKGINWTGCLTQLVRQLPGLATQIGVTQQDPEIDARPADSASMRTLDYIRTARITIQSSFEHYWDKRGKNLRQNLNKQRNRLAREGIATRLQISTSAEEVAQAVADFSHLECTGWKGDSGTAVHADDAQGRFYRSMLENFCRNGAGRIYRYWYDEHLVAMDLCIEGSDSIIILKTAYDEKAVGGTTSPALLMRQEQTALLFGEGRLRRIEFYGKVLEWHTRWSDEVRNMYHLNVYRRPLILRFYDLLHNKAAAPVEVAGGRTSTMKSASVSTGTIGTTGTTSATSATGTAKPGTGTGAAAHHTDLPRSKNSGK